jgi:hypothetical protein
MSQSKKKQKTSFEMIVTWTAFDGADDERREKVGKKFLENLLKHPPLPLTTLGAPPHLVSFCTADTCSNRGVCQDQWISPACDCDLTSFTGPTCTDGTVLIPDHETSSRRRFTLFVMAKAAKKIDRFCSIFWKS